jgi:hypothetical protein
VIDRARQAYDVGEMLHIVADWRPACVGACKYPVCPHKPATMHERSDGQGARSSIGRSAGTEMVVKFDGSVLLDGLTDYEARMGKLMLPVRLRVSPCGSTRVLMADAATGYRCAALRGR